ncbi:hypothetical protein HYH02_011345 [Chlamydomonas schloesseri]|uniref:Uncharacterized protein n=1 Tax=Chlamydomonas schloesseri TaxID=2026947 RepID=A0A835T486_9CHLO|nr:hypothetical protein HYH02_011345 [Chlamydomonas schloesseri]|eukprot:KAG2437086.1 hypothetical protein HYH02_011345 [Chlamydomonas schloesseri]
MSGRWRRREDSPLHELDPDLHIRVDDRAAPLLAHHAVLMLFSRCVRDLPRATAATAPPPPAPFPSVGGGSFGGGLSAAPGGAAGSGGMGMSAGGALVSSASLPLAAAAPPPTLPGGGVGVTVWDLRNLVLEGESRPVSGDVVQRWLDLVYSHVDHGRRLEVLPDLEHARPLLLFADAVGSSSLALETLCRRLLETPGLHLRVPLEQNPHVPSLELALAGKMYYVLSPRSLEFVDVPYTACVIIDAGISDACRAALPGAVAAAVEGWLYLAGRLRLAPLARALIDFVKLQLVPAGLSILCPAVAQVYSPRVLQCLPPELLVEGFLRDAVGDLPSRVQLQAEGPVTLGCASAVAAAWYERAPGRGVELAGVEVTDAQEGRSMLHSEEFADLPVNASMGGLSAEQRDAAVTQALERLLAET